MKQNTHTARVIQKSLFEITKEFIASHSAKGTATGLDILTGCINACESIIAMCLHIMQFRGEQLEEAITAVVKDIKKYHRMFDVDQKEKT